MRRPAERALPLPPRPNKSWRPNATPVPDRAKDVLTLARDILLPLGLLIYGAVRLAAEAFYGDLGINPSEVGLGYIELLSRAAVGLVPFGLLIATYVVVVEWLGLWLEKPRDRPKQSAPKAAAPRPKIPSPLALGVDGAVRCADLQICRSRASGTRRVMWRAFFRLRLQRTGRHAAPTFANVARSETAP